MYVEIKYLNLLSSQLQKFKQTKRNTWNFRCPICGDSQRNKNKARGYVYELKGDLIYKCHNCGVSMPVGKLIETLDVNLYKEYRLEKFKDKQKPKIDMRKVKRVVSSSPVFKSNPLKDLIKIDDLNKSHPAREYLLNRQLPLKALYYTEKFKEWTNSIKPDTFPDTDNDEGRIIIPFKTSTGDVFGYQGRSLSSNGLRYITILLQEDQPKIFGLERLDYEKPIYVTEGPFDSLLLPNAVAMAGADVSLPSQFDDCDVCFIMDNEPRNTAITSRIERLISKGHKVVIWPSTIKQKDINDMFLAGHDVKHLVESNVYEGLSATLQFKEWKK